MFIKTLASLFGRNTHRMSDRELKNWVQNEYPYDIEFAYYMIKTNKFNELQETYNAKQYSS